MISSCFKQHPPENLKTVESEISILKNALESLDFGKLRTDYPELRGGEKNKVIIDSDNDNNLTLSINNRIIHATHQDYKIL